MHVYVQLSLSLKGGLGILCVKEGWDSFAGTPSFLLGGGGGCLAGWGGVLGQCSNTKEPFQHLHPPPPNPQIPQQNIQHSPEISTF